MKYTPRLKDKEIKENHSYFIERVSIYKKMGLDFRTARRLVLKKAGLLQNDLLEIGSGNGYTTLALARAGYKFVSIDKDKEALRKTALNLAYEGLLSNVEFYVMDAGSLSFDDETFHNIMIVNLFHHIDGIDDILSEVDRVLCVNGKAIMADFNKKGMEIIDSVHKREGRIHKDSGVTKNHVYSYFNALGYKMQEFKDRCHWVLITEKTVQQ